MYNSSGFNKKENINQLILILWIVMSLLVLPITIMQPLNNFNQAVKSISTK